MGWRSGTRAPPMRASSPRLRLRVPLERIERAAPEPAHLLEFGDQLPNRVLAGWSEFIYLLATPLFRSDETGLLENPRMFDDCGTAYRESPGKSGCTAGIGSEAPQQFTAGRICQGGNGVVDLHGRYVTC